MPSVSTRQHLAALSEMAAGVRVLRSSVTREATEPDEEELRQSCERHLDELELLVLYMGGVDFGEYHVRVAVDLVEKGKKHILAIAEGASENQAVIKGLPEDLVRRGSKTDRKCLFMIDGSKALRVAKELGHRAIQIKETEERWCEMAVRYLVWEVLDLHF